MRADDGADDGAERTADGDATLPVGVLALQGGFDAHRQALVEAGIAAGSPVAVRWVRRGADLAGLAGLVIPGGESTTVLKLLTAQGLDGAIPDFVRAGGVVFGTCAGAILLAREVRHPVQASFGLLDAAVERNAYGRQVDSFVADLDVEPGARAELGATLPAVFIRAPRFVALGPDVEVLARHGDDAVLVRQGRLIIATFHPELTADRRVHGLFLRACAAVTSDAPRERVAERPLA